MSVVDVVLSCQLVKSSGVVPFIWLAVVVSVHVEPGVQASVTGVTYVPGTQPVPAVVIVRPEGTVVSVALPAGSVGVKDTPLKLESAGAASNCVNDVPGFVVVVSVSEMP